MLWLFWQMRDRMPEGRAWIEELRWAVLTAGMLEMTLGRNDAARTHLTEARAGGE